MQDVRNTTTKVFNHASQGYNALTLIRLYPKNRKPLKTPTFTPLSYSTTSTITIVLIDISVRVQALALLEVGYTPVQIEAFLRVKKSAIYRF